MGYYDDRPMEGGPDLGYTNPRVIMIRRIKGVILIILLLLMLLLMYKAVCRLKQPVNSELMIAASRIDTEHRKELQFLSGALEFFKNLRNAYRLAVGAEDHLRPGHLHLVAAAMGLCYETEEEAEGCLLRAYRGCTAQVAEIVNAIAEDIVRLDTEACPPT